MKNLTLIALSLCLGACGVLEVAVEPTTTPLGPTAAHTPADVVTPVASPTSIPALATVSPIPIPAASPTLLPTPAVPVVRLALETDPSQAFSDIAVVNSDGNGYTSLTTYGYNADPVLSPNGEFIAYRSVPSSITSLADPGARLYEGTYNIWVIAADGSQAWKLTDSEQPRSIPAWSPDSTKVVFSEGLVGRVLEVNPVTGTAREWLAAGGYDPRYKPDGNGIGYITGNGSLAWLTNEGRTQLLVDATQLPAQTKVHDFTWLPNQEAVVYALADERERIGTSTLGIRYSAWFRVLDGTPFLIAENLHDLQPSPTGLYIAGQMGTGYFDACGVDLYQGIVYSAHSLPWTNTTVDTFAGRPVAEAFYPVSPLIWLSDHVALARFSVACDAHSMGAGLYRIDVLNKQLQVMRADPTP